MNFIDLGAQYRNLKDKIDKRINAVLSHGKYIMGPEVFEFEQKLADYIGVKHAISCANGTDALQLCMMCLDVKPGDAVFCPTFTFFATAEVIAMAGATPIFVESDNSTFNICPIDLEKRIKGVLEEGVLNLKSIISVDLFGLPANYPKLKKIAQKYGLILIEDAAQGFGGQIGDKKAGSFGDISTTSFFPAKPLGCYGDGGAVFTDNDDFAELIKSYRVHGKGSDKYDNVRVGMNSRLDTLQAAILLEKLSVFPKEVELRNEIANLYNNSLPDDFVVPQIPPGYVSSWAQYTLMVDDREHLMQKLKSKDIPSMIYYATCMHQQSVFKDMNHLAKFPVSESIASSVMSLPMHPYLQSDDIKKISSILQD